MKTKLAASELVTGLERTVHTLNRRVYGPSLRAFYSHEKIDRADKGSFIVLATLNDRGQLRPSELAGFVALDLSTVSRHVSYFEQLEMVAREPDPDDRRASRITITDKGRAALTAVRAARSDVLDAVFATWPAADRAEFTRLLDRLQEDLEPVSAEPMSADQMSDAIDTASPVFSHRQIVVIMSGLMLGLFLAALDGTVVSTALPTIVGDFHRSDLLSWVITVYLLTSTATTPLWGKAGDLYGRKRVFQLVDHHVRRRQRAVRRRPEHVRTDRLSRYAGHRRRRADGTGLRDHRRRDPAARTGPLSGLLRGDVRPGQRDRSAGRRLLRRQPVSWRYIFYINVPLGILALVVTNRVLRMPVRLRAVRIDWWGALLIVTGVSARPARQPDRRQRLPVGLVAGHRLVPRRRGIGRPASSCASITRPSRSCR